MDFMSDERRIRLLTDLSPKTELGTIPTLCYVEFGYRLAMGLLEITQSTVSPITAAVEHE